MSYTADSRFHGLWLEESFHLEIRQTGDTISLGFEFYLTEDHPLWSEPKPDEWGCYKKGWLIFSSVTSFALNPTNNRPSSDATGEMDFGNVDTFKIAGNNYMIMTDWGTIDLVADAVKVELEK